MIKTMSLRVEYSIKILETPIAKKAFGCTNSIFHLCKMLCYLHMNINCIMKYNSS